MRRRAASRKKQQAGAVASSAPGPVTRVPVPRREGMGCFLGPCLLGVCVGLAVAAVAFNAGGSAFDRKPPQQLGSTSPAPSTVLSSAPVSPTTPRFVPRAEQGALGLAASCARAEDYLTLASEVAAAGDDGHWGWLYLLAAHDLCPTDAHILSNLASNYEAAGYIDIALDELATLGATLDAVLRERRAGRGSGSGSGNDGATGSPASNRVGIVPAGASEGRRYTAALRAQRAHIHDVAHDLETRKRADAHARLFAVLNDADDATTRDPAVAMQAYARAAAALPPARVQMPFATAVAQWEFGGGGGGSGGGGGGDEGVVAAGAAGGGGGFFEVDTAELHRGLYGATMRGFRLMLEQMGDSAKKLSNTELNHRFFTWQMNHLHSEGRYWDGFAADPLWRNLMNSTKAAAAELLQVYGFSAHEAWQKASHRTVLWASVHTGDSLHEPHMTKDSLVGGVYYVHIPPHSGDLVLFDPRGMSPMLAQNVSGQVRAKAETLGTRKPVPPFHRTVRVRPQAGKLVLFPGWLVHQVLPSTGLNVERDGYRISISVNLKGEWQDTAGLMVEGVPGPPPPREH